MTLLQGPLGSLKSGWTAAATLPGGEIPGADVPRFIAELRRRHPWLPADLAQRYAHAYGTRTERILADARSLADLGIEIGDGLHEAEVKYLTFYEWALTAKDVLWRRSKLGLRVSPATVRRLSEWLTDHGIAAGFKEGLQCG